MSNLLAKFISGRKWVYAIGPENAAFKIGKATDLVSRLGQYKTHWPKDPVIAWAFWCPSQSADRAEKLVKRMLADCRLHGEWYDVTREKLAGSFARALRLVKQSQIRFSPAWIREAKQLAWVDVYIDDIVAQESIKIARLRPLDSAAYWKAEIEISFKPHDKWQLASALKAATFENLKSAFEHVELAVWKQRGF